MEAMKQTLEEIEAEAKAGTNRSRHVETLPGVISLGNWKVSRDAYEKALAVFGEKLRKFSPLEVPMYLRKQLKYRANIENTSKWKPGITISGHVQAGKTFALFGCSVLILNKNPNFRIHYISATKLAHQIFNFMQRGDGMTYDNPIRRAVAKCSSDILVIDDLNSGAIVPFQMPLFVDYLDKEIFMKNPNITVLVSTNLGRYGENSIQTLMDSDNEWERIWERLFRCSNFLTVFPPENKEQK